MAGWLAQTEWEKETVSEGVNASSVTRLGDLLDLGNFLKPFSTIKVPHFSIAIIFGQFL